MPDDDIIPEIVYENALALVFDGIAAARKGLLRNPSREEERRLNKTILRLEVERADLEAMLNALLDSETIDVQPPTQAHLDEIARLTGEVARLTREGGTAAGALTVASGILDLAIEVTGG